MVFCVSWNVCFYGLLGEFYNSDKKMFTGIDDWEKCGKNRCKSQKLSNLCYENIGNALAAPDFDIIALQEPLLTGPENEFFDIKDSVKYKRIGEDHLDYNGYHIFASSHKGEGMLTFIKKDHFIVSKKCGMFCGVRAIQSFHTMHDAQEYLVVNIHNNHTNELLHLQNAINEAVKEYTFIGIPKIIILGDLNWKTRIQGVLFLSLIVNMSDILIFPIKINDGQKQTTTSGHKWDMNNKNMDEYSDYAIGDVWNIQTIDVPFPASDHKPIMFDAF